MALFGGLHPFRFLGEHPYLVGGVVVGAFVIYVLTRSTASGTSTAVVNTATPAVDPSVQAAEINAAGAIQLAQVAAQQANNQQATQLALAAQQQAADQSTAALNAQTSTVQQVNAITGQTNLAQIQAGTQNLAISTQGQMMQEQTQAALDAQLSNNALALNQSQIAGAVSAQNTATQAGAAVSVAEAADAAQAQIAGIAGSTQVNLAQIQAGTQQTVAGYGAAVALTQLQDATGLAQQQLDNQASQSVGILNLVKSGQLNKGGSGGANQVAALAALTGQPSIAAPAYQTAAQQNAGSSVTGILSSLGGAIASAGGTVLKGFLGGGGGSSSTSKQPVSTAVNSTVSYV